MDHPISAPSAPVDEDYDNVPSDNFEEIEIDKTVPLSDNEEADTVPGEDDGDAAEQWRISDDDDFVEENITWGTMVEDTATHELSMGSGTMAVAVQKNAPFLGVAGGTDDAVTLFNSVTMEQLDKSNDPNETVNCLSWCFDETYFAAGTLAGDTLGGQVFIYSIVKDNEFMKLELSQTLEGPGGDVEWLSWHPRGYCIMAGFDDGSVWLWMTKTGNLFNILVGHGGNVTCGQFSKDGKLAITGSSDGGLIVWKLSSASVDYNLRPNAKLFGTTELDMYGGHSNAIICLDIHPYLPLVATGAEDNSIKVFNYQTKKVVTTLAKFNDTVETIQWLPVEQDHCILAAASLDGSLRVWNGAIEWQSILTKFHTAPDSVEQHEFKGGITGLRWIIPNINTNLPYNEIVRDAKIVTISLDGTVRLWAINSEFVNRVIGGSNAALVAIDKSIFNEKSQCVIYCAGDEGVIRTYEI